ncbi:MAG: glycosyltransferase family 39 protein [Nanoarchaeota archaeon]
MTQEEIIEKRKSKFISWFNKTDNLILISILVFALVLRIYFFIITMNQPLWWDEACYGSIATNLVTHIWDDTALIIGETKIRPFIFPFIWSILIRLGFQESYSRFLLEFIPSILTVLFVYLSTKELYGKKVAVFSSIIFSGLWIHLFYTFRFMTDIPSMAFLYLSIYLFILATKSDLNKKYFLFSLIFLAFSTLMRYTNGLFFLIYLFMLIISKKFLIKDKKFWIYGIIGISPLLLFFIFNYFTQGNVFPALFGNYLNPAQIDGKPAPFAWHFLNYVYIYLTTPFFIIFILGLFIVLSELIIGYNFIFKNINLRNHLFLILLFITVYSFFIFYLKGAEDRYFLASSLTLCSFAGIGLSYIYSFIKRYNSIVSIVLVLVILVTGLYFQITFANDLIKIKKDSFIQMKQGFEWMEGNSPPGSIIAGSGVEPYAIYYSQFRTFTLPDNKTDQDKILNADYLVYHFFTPQQSYIPAYLQDNQDKWIGLNAWFFDSEQKQPAFVIYKKS